MSNTQAPFGFRPVRRLDGAQPNYPTTKMTIAYNYGTQIAKGDPVKLNTDGTIILATTSATMRGVFWGCTYYDPGTQRTQWQPKWGAPAGLASTQIVTAYVYDDPNLIFEVQVGATSGNPIITQANVGENFDFGGAGSPNAAGMSVAYANAFTLLTTAALTWRVYAMSPRVNNDPASNYNTILAVMNNQDFKTTTGIA